MCIPTCDSVTCGDAADCSAKVFPFDCDGYWECTLGTCIPLCDLTFLCDEQIPNHPPVLDVDGKLLAWTEYDDLLRRVMGFIADCPTDRYTGLPWYMQYADFRYQNMSPKPWPHNPAGLFAMGVEMLLRYWPYTGDRRWFDLVRRPLDALIDQSTPDSYAWPHVAFASADNSGLYRGGSEEGVDGIEPDKVAEAAVGYLRFFQLTGEERYLEEAVHSAQVLVAKIRPGDATRSPWPFRVNARTDAVIEEYTSDMVWPLALFDELARMGRSTAAMVRARNAAWQWLLSYPLTNGMWKGYFEDVKIDDTNDNRDQYTPGELARYLMRHPELDPDWEEHVPALLAWIKTTLGDTDAKWLGATGIREQLVCMELAGSHTARYASLNAMWYAIKKDAAYREEALRSFALASYLARDDGVVLFSICDTSVWFSDGYFDYVPHFVDGMAALPEMAPADADHLLGSSSVITDVRYSFRKVEYTTFDADGQETLRLSFTPTRVVADGNVLSPRPAGNSGPGFELDPASGVLRVFRTGAKGVVIADP